MTTSTPDPILQACQQVARHANAAGLSPQEFAKAMNTHSGMLVESPMITTPNAADAVETQQARQNYLDVLYDQDGRHDPSHPRHGLYTGLESRERWRSGCLVTPLSGDEIICMIRRVVDHACARNFEACEREANALKIFLRDQL